ncbi:MAG: CPBP family intramembrane glutamic endopeptidase [Woeseiaceae bacterium]
MDAHPKSTSSTIRISIAAVLLFQVSALFMRSVMEALLVTNGTDLAAAKYLGAASGFVALGLFLVPVIRDNWLGLKRQFAKHGSGLQLIAASIALGALLWVANSQVLLLASTLDWLTVADQLHAAVPVYNFACSGESILLLAVPIMSVLTPVFEETCSRGLILQSLLPRGRLRAILISSVLFTILHKPETYATAFVFSLFVATQALNWRSLWGPIVTHGTFNLLVEFERTCIDAYWLAGRVQWEVGSVLQISLSVLAFCLLISCWLVSAQKLGTTCVSAAPTRSPVNLKKR